MLAGADDKLVDVSFEYGRNIGLAFQLVDDLLDFVSSKDAMGKPTAADLKLGLATAPVLFACEKVRVFFKIFNDYINYVIGHEPGFSENSSSPDFRFQILDFIVRISVLETS